MAAITALVNQRTGARQGNFNPALYRLAATPANAVFHDTTITSSGVIGCSVSVPSMCNNSTPSPSASTGGLAGFLLTPGYDQATGWGSIDANNLLAALSVGTTQAATSITVSASPSAIFTGNSAAFTAAVSPTTSGTPTGSVQFFSNGVTLSYAIALPASGKVSTPAIPFATALTSNVTAVYSGDASFAVAKSPTLPFVVSNPGFSITAAPASLTLSAGATSANSATLIYTSLGGFSGTIFQSCTVSYNGGGAASFLPTCSYSVPSVMLPSGGTVTSTITIGSTTPHVVKGSDSALFGRPAAGSIFPAIALSALFFPWARRLRRRESRLWPSLIAALPIVIALASISGCGGGSSISEAPQLVGSTTGPYTVSLTSNSVGTIATPAASIALTIQ